MMRNFIVFTTFFMFALGTAQAEQLTLYAAGSLKNALGDVAAAYEKTYQVKVTTKFGPSGLLRKAIEGGEAPDVFASANMAHPEKLAASGWGSPVTLFTRNQLCAIAQAEVEVRPENLLETMLKKDIRLGTSTPKADPSGDYAWKLFEMADKVKPGSFASLSQKALQLTGGPASEKAPQGRNQYGWVMGEKRADVFLTYCTNAVLAQKEVPALKIVAIPEDLAVGADYGLLVRNGASAEAWRLAMFILSPAGQEILKQYGFEAVALPRFN
nr:molybdate ABC transporter substrate-binding protein [uncultured Desulfobulbus sp.]